MGTTIMQSRNPNFAGQKLGKTLKSGRFESLWETYRYIGNALIVVIASPFYFYSSCYQRKTHINLYFLFFVRKDICPPLRKKWRFCAELPDRENRKRPRVGRATVRCLSFASSFSSEIANKLLAKNAKKNLQKSVKS